MKRAWRAMLVIGALAVAGCQGTDQIDQIDPEPDSGTPDRDPYAPCTDPMTCCTSDEQKTCVGGPDSRMSCTCRGLWDCSKDPKKCEQPLPVPPGVYDWQCTWGEFKYTCTPTTPPNDKGPNPQDLPGGSSWACKYNQQQLQWECTSQPPNPANDAPGGTSVWKCQVAGDLLVCERTDTSVSSVPDILPVTCKTVDARTVCTDAGGLPPGGSDWKCHKVMQNGYMVWVCYGNATEPPGGGGWNCTKVDEPGTWRCTKISDWSDMPPGGGWYACAKGSEFGGTQCVKVPTEPLPPTPTPKPGDTCRIGEKRWCDGLQYRGWGQVVCDAATNKWRTIKNSAGNAILDCQEPATGERPNTVCACFHFFFNPDCCERPDCILPSGSNGQICPVSRGGLCDYCNPQSYECKEAGAKCVVSSSRETFCGGFCSPTVRCPGGYQCLVVKLSDNRTSSQCVPADHSCYY